MKARIHKPALTTNRLTVGYPVAPAPIILFEDLMLNLYAGELVCFMGPNGVGKSTLIRTLAGLQKPIGGETGRDSSKSIAVVLTDRVTGSNMTVYDLVSYGRYPYLGWMIQLQPGDLEAIERSLERVHIGHLRDKHLHELSDGQLQMAMIARALAQETPIMLLDEPTAHLDLNNRLEIMNLLRTLARTTGQAILVATHELDLALQTADVIWLATDSKEIKTGIPEDLVLAGSFDEVFKLKGFDLRTGKIIHQPFRTSFRIGLKGEGIEYLWTKNALERSGYEVARQGDLEVVVQSEGATSWALSGKTLHSIGELLDELDQG